MCGFPKNVLVAEKLQCIALSIGRHLEISPLLLMSAENNETVSLKLCFLGFVHRHNELFFSYLWSFIRKFISSDEIRIRVDEERTPTHYNRFMASLAGQHLFWGGGGGRVWQTSIAIPVSAECGSHV